MEEKKILYKAGQGEYIEKKSRFIADLFPVQSEEEAMEYLANIKKKHYSARHHCYAYVIEKDGKQETRCSDDGEPSNTAGRPMLEILQGENITGVMAIVTRYFGGTLLGTGGLVRSYSNALKEAIKDACFLEKKQGRYFYIETDYNGLGKIQYISNQLGLHEQSVNYGEKVHMVLLVEENLVDKAQKEIVEKTSATAQIEKSDIITYGLGQDEIVIY